jgi:hypothetical protein
VVRTRFGLYVGSLTGRRYKRTGSTGGAQDKNVPYVIHASQPSLPSCFRHKNHEPVIMSAWRDRLHTYLGGGDSRARCPNGYMKTWAFARSRGRKDTQLFTVSLAINRRYIQLLSYDPQMTNGRVVQLFWSKMPTTSAVPDTTLTMPMAG